MDKKSNADKPVVDAIVVTKPVVKLSLPQPKAPEAQRVYFEYKPGKGWDVYVTGTDDPHEAVHMFLAVCEAATGIMQICAMHEARRQPDGRWRVGAAEPEAILASLIKAASKGGS
jgi:hypothetical protein